MNYNKKCSLVRLCQTRKIKIKMALKADIKTEYKMTGNMKSKN